ncbi:hypothetical protein BH20ACT23_BH20ACT23_12050 [soil metagenome]
MTSMFRGLRTSALLVAAVLLSLVLATVPSASAAAGPRIDPKLTSQLSKLSLGDKLGAFVHFDSGSAGQQRSLVRSLGLTVVAEFPSVDALYAAGPSRAIRACSTGHR